MTEPETPATVQPKKPTWIWVAVAVVVAAVASGAFLLTRTSTFTVEGVIEMPRSGTTDQGSSCKGTGGYSDMRPGAPVVIRTADGVVVGVGSLEPGVTESSRCVFAWRVTDIEDVADFYTVEVSKRGELPYSSADMRGVLRHTLGI